MSLIAWVLAAAFAAMGIVGIVAPARAVALVGIELTSAASRSEVRAIYGGFGLATGAALAYVAATGLYYTPALLAVTVALGGMAAGRLVSLVIDRDANRWVLLFLGIEVLAAAAAFWGALGVPG